MCNLLMLVNIAEYTSLHVHSIQTNKLASHSYDLSEMEMHYVETDLYPLIVCI